jgi:hypothetical protein
VAFEKKSAAATTNEDGLRKPITGSFILALEYTLILGNTGDRPVLRLLPSHPQRDAIEREGGEARGLSGIEA